MAKRRPSGDGMVRKREDGRWEGRIVVGHKDNRDSIFRYISAPTQKELSAKLRQLTETYKGVDLTEESNMSLSVWLDKWLDEYMAATLHSERLPPLSGTPCQTPFRRQASLKNHRRRPAVALPHLAGNRASAAKRWSVSRPFRQNSPRHPHHSAPCPENGDGTEPDPK